MNEARNPKRLRFWSWLIAFIGVIVPRRLRADWRQEWEAELQYREDLLAKWDQLNWRTRLDLLWHSAGAFADALWLQPKRWEDEMVQDLRFGARMLLKHKGFTAVAVLSLALGIGANTAIFSLADALLWRALPAANNDRLFTLARGDGGGTPFSYPDYVDYRGRNRVFAGVAAYEPITLAFGAGDRSRVVMGELVTSNFFEVLGAPMAHGRAFLPEEDSAPGAHPVVVVSHDFWQRGFSGDPQLVGKTVMLNNHGFTVIGVAAEGFAGASIPSRADVWVPVMMRAAVKPNWGILLNDRQAETLWVIGQLKTGVSRAQAEAELETINRQLQQAYPAPNWFNLDAAAFQQSRRLTLAPARGTLQPGTRQIAMMGTTLATVVAGIVLLIACANVANLLLARAATMTLDLGLQGYSEERGRQFYQQLVERLAATPGVRSITIADNLPLGFIGMIDQISIEGQPPPTDSPPIMAARQRIGLRYFETTGTPLLRGRDFTASSERVVIVNETLARRHWPNLKDIGEVIGRRIRIDPDPNTPWSVIVGVAGDCKYFGLGEEQWSGMWTPLTQTYAPSFQALARTTTETPNIVAAFRREVAALDPNLPIQNVTTLRDQVGLHLWSARMIAGLMTALGCLGLLLAAVGLYGVMSYAVRS